MTVSRRRFLAISAGVLASAAAPLKAGATTRRWHGRALGAEVSVTLAEPDHGKSLRIWREITRELASIETRYSLFQESSLVRLNRTGIVRHPGADMVGLFTLADRLHRATGGAFDPTVQVLWDALARRSDLAAARALTGWSKVRFSPDEISLPHGMALTFNGIAQGHAADRVTALLRKAGYRDVLVDMGELSALGSAPDGRAWQAAIANPRGQLVGRIALRDRALATSSPRGQLVGRDRHPHILHPARRRPLWDTVSVSAASAALADGLSTAFCLMTRAEIAAALTHYPDARLELCL